MKFTAALSLLILGVAAEQPTLVSRDGPSLVGRDLATVTGVLDQLGTGLGSLDTAVKGFSGESTNLLSASSNLQSTFKSGASTVEGTSNLSLSDALTLQSSVTTLQTQANTLISDLESQKTAFEAAGLCSAVESQVTDIQTQATSLINAVVAKVPSEAQSIAQNLVAPFNNAFKEAVSAFSTGNCTDTGSSSGGSSSAAGGTATTSKASTAATSSTVSVATTKALSATSGVAGATTKALTTTTRATGTGTGAVTATSSGAQFTGAAMANNVPAKVGGILALAAAVLAL